MTSKTVSKEEIDKVSEAIYVLHKHFEGKSWNVEIGDTMYSPDDFVMYKPITVNGIEIGAFNVEVAQDKKALQRKEL